VDPSESASRFGLIDVTDPRVLASLAPIDAMSDDKLRALARDEHPMMVEAAEGIISRRHAGDRQPS
jgi:hypothetical protein